MLFKDVIGVIERTARPELAAAWDKSGIQIATARKNVSRLGVFLDATPQNIQTALAGGADCLLSHHPIALKPELPAKLDEYHEILRLLLGANVPLYAAHTSLDVNQAGPAGWLARALELQNTVVLEPVDEAYGYGQAGNLPEAMDIGELCQKLLALLGMKDIIRAGQSGSDKIRRVAICGGSGSSLLNLAEATGAEVFITGDVKYHTALSSPMPILDVGHHSIEEKMMELFSRQLAQDLPEMEILFVPSISPFTILHSKGDGE